MSGRDAARGQGHPTEGCWVLPSDEVPYDDQVVLLRLESKEWPIALGFWAAGALRFADASLVDDVVLGWMPLEKAARVLDGMSPTRVVLGGRPVVSKSELMVVETHGREPQALEFAALLKFLYAAGPSRFRLVNLLEACGELGLRRLLDSDLSPALNLANLATLCAQQEGLVMCNGLVLRSERRLELLVYFVECPAAYEAAKERAKDGGAVGMCGEG